MTDRAAYEASVRASGIDAAEPLYAILLGLYDRIEKFEGTIDRVGSGLSVAAEQDLAFRVVEATMKVFEREVKKVPRKLDKRTSIIFVAVALTVFAIGYNLRGFSVINDDFLSMIVRANDPAAIKSFCLEHLTRSGARHTCLLPSVWLP